MRAITRRLRRLEDPICGGDFRKALRPEKRHLGGEGQIAVACALRVLPGLAVALTKIVPTASSTAADAATRRRRRSRLPGADWKATDVSHGPGCPKNLLEEAMDTPNGSLVRRCFRLPNAKSSGLTITLSDITEEKFRVLELIEAARQKQIRSTAPGS